MSLKVVIIAEKLGTYDAEDSTKIALEALNRGHKVYEVYAYDINYFENTVIANARIFDGAAVDAPQVAERLDLNKVDVIHFRPNPPVNMGYLTILYMLNQLSKNVLIANLPESIIKFPEKVLPLQFSDFTPKTLISSDAREIGEFVNKYKEVVIKPLYEFGGRGIKKFSPDNYDVEFVTESVKKSGAPLVIQQFLPRVTEGDKRILFVYGDPVGAFVRKPKDGSYLANIAQGGSIHSTELTAREKEFAAKLKPFLVEHGIYICGIDVIDNYVTEINITSPGGFTEIEQLYGERPQVKLWDIIEEKVKA